MVYKIYFSIVRVKNTSLVISLCLRKDPGLDPGVSRYPALRACNGITINMEDFSKFHNRPITSITNNIVNYFMLKP